MESRLLLYATLGANWTYGSRITYSFVPDGTEVGGLSSNLFSTLNAKFSTATWQAQFQKAAAAWESYANINLVNVSDNGTRMGGGSYQQGDPNMGDIRISMASLPSGQLAFTLEPPPSNGGSDAGDIVFNSNMNWQINTAYDIMTVALHEFGHALGLDHSTSSTAAMYSTYTGVKQSLSADDIAGIQSIYGAPQADSFEGTTTNNTYLYATNINSYIGANGQAKVAGANISVISDTDWYYVTAPANTTGTMTVTMQSSDLSSLSPKVMLYNSSMTALSQAYASGVFGATVTVTITGVTPGQSFYIRAMPASSPCAIGAYGILVNFGSQAQTPISPPNTQVLNQLDGRGGSLSQVVSKPASDSSRIQIGSHTGWGDVFTVISQPILPGTKSSNSSTTTVSGIGWLNSAATAGLSLPNLTAEVVASTWASLLGPNSSDVSNRELVAQAVDDILALWRVGNSSSLFAEGVEGS